MLSYRVAVVVCILSLAHHYTRAQHHYITGTVLGGDNNSSLPGASVYLANTTFGSLTDADGVFTLENLPAGKFTLVISFIGYEKVQLEIDTENPKRYTVILQPSGTKLSEVVISGKRTSDWYRNYKIFVRNFIGLSDNASKCKIINPRTLQFSIKNEMLSAKADSVIVVENWALGYLVKFELEKFTYFQSTRKLYYKGHVLYVPMDPVDQKQRVGWAKNRIKSYEGSQMHFLRSLYTRSVIEEGFYMNLFVAQVNDKGVKTSTALPDSSFYMKTKVYRKPIHVDALTNYNRVLDSLSENPILVFKGSLEVFYVHESPPSGYDATYSLKTSRFQRSRLLLLRPGALVQPNGTVSPEDSLESEGYWGWELVSESLPTDYNPRPDLELLARQP